MFLSSFRRPPSSNNRGTPNRNLPAATISGTSIARTRNVKLPEQRPVVNAAPKPNPVSAVSSSDPSKQFPRKEP